MVFSPDTETVMNKSTLEVYSNTEEAEREQQREWARMTPEERLLEQAELRQMFPEGTLKDPSLLSVRSLHSQDE